MTLYTYFIIVLLIPSKINIEGFYPGKCRIRATPLMDVEIVDY